MLKIIKRPIAIISIIVVLGGAGVYFYFTRTPAPVYETVAARRGIIFQEVSVIGKTKPAESVDLAFEAAGKVKRVNVVVGDKVFTGQILAELDSAELYAQLLEAEANIESQKAKLDELNKGVRPETIQYYETKVVNAKISLENAKKNLIDKIQDAYTKSEDAVRNKVDQFFSNPRTTNPTLIFSVADSHLVSDVLNERVAMEYALAQWNSSLNNLGISSDLDVYFNSAKNNLEKIRSFLTDNALILNALNPTSSLTQATIDAYRVAVSSGRTSVNTALANLQSVEEDLRTAESNVALAEKDLAVQGAGSTLEQIAVQVALVKKAEAGAQIIKVKIGKNILRSPIGGVLTRQDAKFGEIVFANSSIVSIISTGKFEIEANVPEADIAKVKIGDSAKVTLDAFGNDVFFDAKVVEIEPAETVIEGVATYKTTFQFMKSDEGVKSGMTANIDILTGKKENAIIISRRAVISKNGDKIVRLLNADGTIEEREVKTGLIGSDGNVEITEGLNEGERVIISAENE